MTREAQIYEAQKRICTHVRQTNEQDYHGHFHTECSYDPIEGMGFIEGAEWADEHPISPWISVNSSNPSDHKVLHRTFNGILIRDKLRTVPVIARAVNGDNVIHIMAYMYLNKDTNLWEWVSLNKPIGKVYSITHWMLIPEL